MKQPTAREKHMSFISTVSGSVVIPTVNRSGDGEEDIVLRQKQARTFGESLRNAMFWYALSAAICMTAALTVLAPDLIERIASMVAMTMATITAVTSFLSAHPRIINRRSDTR
jgi:polyferredoxin